MTEAQARLCLAAARDDPLVAAWISILDQHQLPPRTEVAPDDFAQAFADLFWLDLVSAERFNAADFKHRLFDLTPSPHDIDRALLRLADLRGDHLKELLMDDKFDSFPDPKALALREAEPRRSLTRAEPFAPLTLPDAPAPFAMLVPSDPAPGAFDLLEPTPGFGARARAAELASARRALEPRTGLPCQRVNDDADDPDPRTYVHSFDLRLFCCGVPVELEYENGEEVGAVEGTGEILVEFTFHGECEQCHGRKFIHETRPLRPEVWR